MKVFAFVPGDSQRTGLSARLSNLGDEHRFVGVANLTGTRSLPDGDQFITRREDGDPRSRSNRQLVRSHLGQRRKLLGTQSAAGRQYRLADAHTRALANQVLFRPGTVGQDSHGRTERLGFFDLHDRIRAIRQRRAGHDPCGFIGSHRGLRQPAGHDFVDNLQRAFAGPDVGTSHGVAVHQRLIEGRRVDVAGHILCQHKPQSVRKFAPPRRGRLYGADDLVECLGHRQHVRLPSLLWCRTLLSSRTNDRQA